MQLKNGKKLYNERGITFFHETRRYVNNLNIYNRSKNGTNLWDELIKFSNRGKIVIYLNISVLFIILSLMYDIIVLWLYIYIYIIVLQYYKICEQK